MLLDITIPESLCNDGDVRLVGGNTNSEGRVEICINSAWGTVCDSGWDTQETSVVCSQLGFLPQGHWHNNCLNFEWRFMSTWTI